MTDPDFQDTAPGMGDPTRSDDLDSEGLRSDNAGSGPDGEDVQAVSGPGPQTDWLRSASGDGTDRGSGDAPPTDLDPQDTEAGRP